MGYLDDAKLEREIAQTTRQLAMERQKVEEERLKKASEAKGEKEFLDALEGGPIRARAQDNFDHNAFQKARENGQRLLAAALAEEMAENNGPIRPGRIGTV